MNKDIETCEQKLVKQSFVSNNLNLGNLTVCTKPGHSQNQDFGSYITCMHISAIAIADGLGSSEDAQIASKCAVNKFLEDVKRYDDEKYKNNGYIKLEDVKKFWVDVSEAINNYYKKNEARYEKSRSYLKTTLITVIEFDDRYLISYLGNGSILYIRGDFWRFMKKTTRSSMWPKCISDLMISHSDPEKRLYGILGPGKINDDIRFISLSKNDYCGEIIILTTDGISSLDDTKIYIEKINDEDEKLWIGVNPHIERLINRYLKEYFKKNIEIFLKEKNKNLDEIIEEFSKEKDENEKNKNLNEFIEEFEKFLKEKNKNLDEIIERFLIEEKFEDDATIGIIISKNANSFMLERLLKNED